MTNFCLFCKKEFKPSDYKQKYCSVSCRVKRSNRANYKKNRKELISRMQEWRLKNPEKAKKLNDRWRRIRPKYQVIYQQDIRVKALKHYGKGNIKCNCCGEKLMEVLNIDHINEGGKIHRKSDKSSRNITAWVTKNGFPDGFQILCVNCNFAKSKYGGCPHKDPTKGIYSRFR